MSIVLYESSKRGYETQQSICEILKHSTNSINKLEAGPIYTIDKALSIVKPDIFTPIDIDFIKPKVCDQDPQVWWVVTTMPVCFGWKNGYCKNIVVNNTGVQNCCKFRHEPTPYIKVDMVTTDILLKKMKNRTKKLRENGSRNKKPYYINPFTGIMYPCNYNKGGIKDVENVQIIRKKFIEIKNKMINEIKQYSTHLFAKNTNFTTKWVIGNRGKLEFVKDIFKKSIVKIVKKEEMGLLELDEYLRTSPASSGGKSWADMTEDADNYKDKINEAKKSEINDGWTVVCKK